MKIIAPLLLLAAPAAAQTLPSVPSCSATNIECIKKRADVRKVRGDVYTGRASVEYKAEAADRALIKPPVVVPPVVTPPHTAPVVVPPVAPPVVMPPMPAMGNMPVADISKIPAPAVGFSNVRIQAATDTPSKNSDATGQFRITCTLSHMSFDDPVVYPGQKDAAHLHLFFGNTGINYASTAESIKNSGNSTCAGGIANRTGYWAPAVIDTKDGTPLKPTSILVYYKSDFLPGATTKPFPEGLRMIAGDMRSTSPQDRTDWGCSAPDGTELVKGAKSIPAACPVGSTVINTIEFPTCWNGVDLDSADHKSHMAFTVWDNELRKLTCPKTHPVQLPTITQKVQYSVLETGSTTRWRLSSDNYGTDKPGGYSTHADWFNGWDAKVEDVWLKNCLQAARDCHGYLLGDGTTLY